MEYKPTKEDVLFAKSVWENQIAKMVYNPNDLKEAYQRLYGEPAATPQLARTKINAYFRFRYEEFLKELEELMSDDLPEEEGEKEYVKMVYKDGTCEYIEAGIKPASAMSEDTPPELQSHSEDADSELVKLEKALEAETDNRKKGAIKRKITLLKKDMDV